MRLLKINQIIYYINPIRFQNVSFKDKIVMGDDLYCKTALAMLVPQMIASIVFYDFIYYTILFIMSYLCYVCAYHLTKTSIAESGLNHRRSMTHLSADDYLSES
jgi:hypothetical protein